MADSLGRSSYRQAKKTKKGIIADIKTIIANAQQKAARAIDSERVLMYWQIGHFQLVSTGWHKGAFSFDVLMHFDVRKGKIWVMQNWTEEEVAEAFVRRGVPAQDIVLGFVPEEGRVYSGFGVG